jgi:hypothetical protein
MPILALKKQYNILLKRHNRATEYLDDMSKSINDREKWLPEYKTILQKLNSILGELKGLGIKVTDDEIIDGFEVD